MDNCDQNNLNELLIQNGYCACMPSRTLDIPISEFIEQEMCTLNVNDIEKENCGTNVYINPMLSKGKFEERNHYTLNQLSSDIMKAERITEQDLNNFENMKFFKNTTENEPINIAYVNDQNDFESKDDDFESISEGDMIKINPKIVSNGRIKLNSDQCTNVRNLQTFKSMIGVTSNYISSNCGEEADMRNPSKVINPHGMALQITTSDIPTIKSIMQYAAENSQEVTVIIPMRKTKNVTACPHYDRKHYAKNMCSACYNKNGRTKKAWACGHPDKVHYAKGLCQFCYLAKYHKENSTNKS